MVNVIVIDLNLLIKMMFASFLDELGESQPRYECKFLKST